MTAICLNKQNWISHAAVLLAAWAIAAPGSGAAQQLDIGGISGQIFFPVEDEGRFLISNDTDVLPVLGTSAGLFLNYASEPVVLMKDGAVVRRLVDNLLTTDVLFAIGVTDIVQFNVSAPVNLYADGTQLKSNRDFSATSMGDLRFKAKVRILPRGPQKLGLAAIPFVTAPSGNKKNFLGDETVTGGILAAADTKIPHRFLQRRLYLGANLGIAFRKPVDTPDQIIGNQLLYSLSGNLPVSENNEFMLDIFGRSVASEPLRFRAGTPLEVDLTAKFLNLQDLGFVIYVGLGRGLTAGIGAPAVRTFAGLFYRNPPHGPEDADADGLVDEQDMCPNDAEDIDDYQDQDGCPDLPGTVTQRFVRTTDGQSVDVWAYVEPGGRRIVTVGGAAVLRSQEPLAYHLSVTAEGYRAMTTSVTIVPGADIVATAHIEPLAGIVLGKIYDLDTRKPVSASLLVSGTTDSAATQRGAFRLETQQFGAVRLLVDAVGYEDATEDIDLGPGVTREVNIGLRRVIVVTSLFGSVTDATTSAPIAATVTLLPKRLQRLTSADSGAFSFSLDTEGSYTLVFQSNGYDDKQVTATVALGQSLPFDVALARKQIKIANQRLLLDPIFFETGKAGLLSKSFPVLDTVLQFLIQNPSIRLRIEGHTDNIGSESSNAALSQMRASAVRSYLTSRGIAVERLAAEGFGESVPIDTNDTAEGRARNRRVEFVIVEGSVISDPATSPATEPVNGSAPPSE